MGRPKEALVLGDNTLLGRAVDTLLACSFPVVVVAGSSSQGLPPLSLEAEVTFDEDQDAGPLVGLLAGLRAVGPRCNAVFVTGCDSPFLSAQAVDWLASQLGDHEVVMPRVDDRLQPLAAVYRTSILPEIEAMIREGIRTPRTIAERCETRILTSAEIDAFDPNHRFLQNINTPDDYRSILSQLDSRGGA